jgi:hypothetical protein
MKAHHVSRLGKLLAAAAFTSLLLSSPVRAQETFAVGAAGSIVNDTGTAANTGSFDTAAAHVFGEVAFETWGVLQARYSRFGLPGTQPGAPNLRVDAGTLTVGYLFQEDWWRAGIYAGGGLYHLAPRSPEEGQVAVDGSETVFGWTGGLITIFDVGRRWDVRLEVSGCVIRSEVSHTPILVTAGFAYQF